jgi:hypothetical protein
MWTRKFTYSWWLYEWKPVPTRYATVWSSLKLCITLVRWKVYKGKIIWADYYEWWLPKEMKWGYCVTCSRTLPNHLSGNAGWNWRKSFVKIADTIRTVYLRRHCCKKFEFNDLTQSLLSLAHVKICKHKNLYITSSIFRPQCWSR